MIFLPLRKYYIQQFFSIIGSFQDYSERYVSILKYWLLQSNSISSKRQLLSSFQRCDRKQSSIPSRSMKRFSKKSINNSFCSLFSLPPIPFLGRIYERYRYRYYMLAIMSLSRTRLNKLLHIRILVGAIECIMPSLR